MCQKRIAFFIRCEANPRSRCLSFEKSPQDRSKDPIPVLTSLIPSARLVGGTHSLGEEADQGFTGVPEFFPSRDARIDPEQTRHHDDRDLIGG